VIGITWNDVHWVLMASKAVTMASPWAGDI